MEILLFILLPIFIYVFMSTDNCIDYSEVVEKMKKDIDKKEEKWYYNYRKRGNQNVLDSGIW